LKVDIKKPLPTACFIALVLTSSLSFVGMTMPVMTRVGDGRPLSEFSSFLGSGDVAGTEDELEENENGQSDITNNQDKPTSNNTEYEEFQSCLADTIGDKVEASTTEQIIRGCLESSYARDGESIPSTIDGSGEDDGIPDLH
jgi:hypothetical protein